MRRDGIEYEFTVAPLLLAALRDKETMPVRNALLDGPSLLAVGGLVIFFAIVFPQVKHDPVSPDGRFMEARR